MKYFFISILVVCCMSLEAQTRTGELQGTIIDKMGRPLPGISVLIDGTKKGAATNFDGIYNLKSIVSGNYTLIVSGIGFKTEKLSIRINPDEITNRDIILIEDRSELSEVVIKGKTKAAKIEEKGFSVTAIETQKLKSQNLGLNSILTRTTGINVRTSGGVGSDYNYSLNGMSGNAIRFFIDGIPMDYFGSSYSINNLPVSLIDRIDIYKGVVPVSLGSDALGGAINLVTNQKISNFLEASYSFGSFNTHKIALHGQWQLKSGLTTKLSTFYTYSDNNYKVWGKGVHYADESTGFKAVEFTRDNPAERFNDDFQTTSAKLDIGFTQKKWADQFFLTLLASDTKKGIQTAQTMARVFGKVRNNEQVIMPSISYKKTNLITKGLDVNAFAGYTYTEGVLIDTSHVQYDWRGMEIGVRESGGEMGYDGKSEYTQKNQSQIYRLNTTYQLPSDFKLGFNYLYSTTRITGEDPFTPEYRIPYLEPQNIRSQFAGLSLETVKFNNKLRANAFVKYYGYNASINDLEYTDEWEIIEYKNKLNNWGGGFAASYRFSPELLIKTSLEQATRMPSPTEALGDGVTVNNNPFINPEQSFNVNLGTILGRYKLGSSRHGIKIAVNTFYRDVTDKLLFTVIDGQGNGEFRNIDRISGTGIELDFIYDFDYNFKFKLNGTYQDLRNNLEFDEDGRENIVYRDRMRNEPYFMANAGLDYNVSDYIQKNSKIFAYLQSSYTHEFFLRWPSLGSEENKSIVPSQLVFDAGIGYTFPSKKFILAVDIFNMFNEQVYDNYLLQKPGRAIFLKINYKITQQ
ncbi:TonB-dependent receptor [Flavivirga aquimarina]|uniref:TonB-dependent receptor n=1 Tax=Flavivirga aquimarina TaxID=2027862 RepID=A0ABT8WD80_9FLAO|nr:TonB-dependent receptor [Flavivirga aquimarina]MDO5971056.1 TonB-dependent receptor [Flavivirga aquimarina]